jgi:2-haloacid dehalogenase
MWAIPQNKKLTYTFDDAHREALNSILDSENLNLFTEKDRHYISHKTVHTLQCWSDFSTVQPKLRQRFICAPLTVLSYRIVIDTARHNGLHWDSIFACQGIGEYKPAPEVYLAGARYLQLDPSECLMVACHNFDLNAAKAVGFRTAFVHRDKEWGNDEAPILDPISAHDYNVRDFHELAAQLM